MSVPLGAKQFSTQWGMGALSSEVMRPRGESDNVLPFGAEQASEVLRQRFDLETCLTLVRTQG
jgi:hypothetical protein